MKKLCRFAMMDQNLVGAAKLPIPPGTHVEQVKFFTSTTDIVLLSIEPGSLKVWAEVHTDRTEVCEHNFLIMVAGQSVPDEDHWRYWCSVTVNGTAHIYILRNAPYSLPA